MKTRRHFLKHSAAGLVGTTSVINTLANLRMAANCQAQASSGEYKALVCVFLAGGNDSFNMLSPRTAAEYSAYAASRSNMALPLAGSGASLPITPSNTAGRTFGVHPAMPDIKNIFDSGKLAFLANVGTLVEPTTIAQFNSGGHVLPRALFSHNDQVGQWHTSVPQGDSKTGWGGRTADILHQMNTSQDVSMNISIAGTNIFQTGDQINSYSVTSGGSVGLEHSDDVAGSYFGERNSGVNALLEDDYGNVLRQAYADSTKEALDTHEAFSSIFNSSTVATAFPTNSLGGQLKAVARIIKARSALGAKRQVFFVTHGGYDTHGELLNTHNALMKDVNDSLSAFWNALGELNLRDEVTTFQCSDFGRTLRSNGQGTDHAWGGNVMVMGGKVDGGKMYGQYPSSLSLGVGLDVGSNGRMLPTTSCDEYFCELLRWYGISAADMTAVLPNIANFYNPYSATSPLGFML